MQEAVERWASAGAHRRLELPLGVEDLLLARSSTMRCCQRGGTLKPRRRRPKTAV